ncbi:DUF4232 domain-containing protein [Micromonospora sp. NPDC048930]|uniref:DUF4232 domain-containing protein n=1 Tax=Micromonospora sp. NPDC048930 TaxID=3364261 RepID=UPI003720EBAF
MAVMTVRPHAGRAYRHLLLVGVLALPGCGSEAAPSTAAPESTVTASTATSGAPITASPTRSTVPAAGTRVPQRCTVTQLDVVLGDETSGSGHRGVRLIFQNRGDQACWLRGYPGADGLDRAGKTLAHAKRTPHGYLGGVRGDEPVRVLLAPGELASALVEALAFRAGDGGACAPYASLLVTPPDETRSVRLAWTTDSCSALEVHPVVAGTTGRSG